MTKEKKYGICSIQWFYFPASLVSSLTLSLSRAFNSPVGQIKIFARSSNGSTSFFVLDQDLWPGKCLTGKVQSPINIGIYLCCPTHYAIF